MLPNAALTPYLAPPTAPQFHPVMKAGILKKTKTIKKHKYPPGKIINNLFNKILGPPCGLPPDLSVEEDRERLKLQQEFEKEQERKVRFTEQPKFDGDDEEDYAPVEIPESMFTEPIIPSLQSVYMRGGDLDFHQAYSLQAAQQQRFYQSSWCFLFKILWIKFFRLSKFRNSTSA